MEKIAKSPVVNLIKSIKAANEAKDRIDSIIATLKEENRTSSVNLVDLNFAQIGIRIYKAMLHKELHCKETPNVKNKNRYNAARVLAEHVRDDNDLKEYTLEQLVDFFSNTQNQKLPDLFWFEDTSEKFRSALNALKAIKKQEDYFNWSSGDEDYEQ